MNNLPGKNRTAFYVTFDSNYFKKGDTLFMETPEKINLKVIKTYEFTWWKKLLFRIEFKFKSCDMIKVKPITK